MPRVFIVQHTQHKVDGRWEKRDVSAATAYGELVELIPPGPMIMATPASVVTIKHKLRGFGEQDYLLCMGDPALIGIACIVASQNNAGRYKVLVWDKETKSYIPLQVDINSRIQHSEATYG